MVRLRFPHSPRRPLISLAIDDLMTRPLSMRATLTLLALIFALGMLVIGASLVLALVWAPVDLRGARLSVPPTTPHDVIPLSSSWDGHPPGTLADLVSMPAGLFAFGAPDFPAGRYYLFVDGGRSPLYDSDIVGFEGDTHCAQMYDGCKLGKAEFYSGGWHGTMLEVVLDRPWHLWGSSFPSQLLLRVDHQPSTGNQFAVASSGPSMWIWGFEDIRLPSGDADYQDVYGRVQYLGPLR